jgi:hypothetical protein
MLAKIAMIAVLIIFGLFAAGLGFGLVATATAPMGYQDDDGFHFGREQATSLEEFHYGVPQPKLV